MGQFYSLLLACHQTSGTTEKIAHFEIIIQNSLGTQFHLLFKNLRLCSDLICFPLNFLFHYQPCVLICKNEKVIFRTETEQELPTKGISVTFYVSVRIHVLWS